MTASPTEPCIRVVGEIMVDTLAHVQGPLAIGSDTPATVSDHDGGSAANLAIWLARGGLPVELIACVGEDPPGDRALARLAEAGVRAAVRRVPGMATGRCVVIVGADAERTMLPDPGANAALSPADIRPGDWSPDDHLHVSGYSLLRDGPHEAALVALAAARSRGMGVSVDASSAEPLRVAGPERVLSACAPGDILFANSAEAAVLTGEPDPEVAAEHLAARGLIAVVKCGSQGAIAVHGDERHDAPPPAVAAVDSTGAGDAFAAGFLGSWSREQSLPVALMEATRLAGHAVSATGARP